MIPFALSPASQRQPSFPFHISIISAGKCHELYCTWGLFLILLLNLAAAASGQTFQPPLPPPPAPAEIHAPSPNPAVPVKPPRPNAPTEDEVLVNAVSEERNGSVYHLRGKAHVETTNMALDADAMDYDENTGDATANGNVRYQNFVTGEKLQCDHATYNVDDLTGKFYSVTGTSPAKIESKPGLLTTSNPFYFQAKWAERIKERYILYDGFVTDCKVPRPWWRLRGKRFVIYPKDKAIAYRSVFFIRWIPIFYTPWFYRSLARNPRESGFLTPNVGHSTLFGEMSGLGYYWAINDSSDLMYRGQYFTSAGLASSLTFREKFAPHTDFSIVASGLDDRGGPNRIAAPGFTITAHGRADLGDGWQATGSLNYLSSFTYRQEFSQSFTEAIFNESHSVGDLTKHSGTWGVNVVADRIQTFDFVPSAPNDNVVIRHLPEGEFLMRETPLSTSFPLWFSLDATAGAMDRSEPSVPGETTIETQPLVDRIDVYPHLTSSIRFGDFTLVPSFSVRETEYGASLAGDRALSASLLLSSREFSLDIIPPSFARVFPAPAWLGKKLKHVIEPRAQFHYVGGIGDDALRVIRFDDADLMTDTKELKISLTNRLYVKRKDNGVDEILTWELSQIRYFDPTFGGAVVDGQRNVIWSTLSLTPFAFLDGPRHYSPVTSLIRFQKKVNLEWETDYDPLRKGVVANVVGTDYRFSHFVINIGQALVRDDSPTDAVTVLTPTEGQFRGLIGYGDATKHGVNAAMSFYYDYRAGEIEYMAAQGGYNTNCCGFSVQYRRLHFGTFDDVQILGSFGIANVGSFGTLKRQERIF